MQACNFETRSLIAAAGRPRATRMSWGGELRDGVFALFAHRRLPVGELLVNEAAKARSINDLARARDLYIQAVGLDPTNAVAAEGRNDMLMYLGQSPDTAVGVRRVARLDVKDLAIKVDLDTALACADEALASGDLARADVEYEKARAAAVSNPGIFSHAAIRDMDSRLQASRRRIDAARTARIVGDTVGGCVVVLAVGVIMVFGAAAWRRTRRRRTGYCQKCGYVLTGNASGVCPECGKPVEENAGALVGDLG
jgi:hypothetical protein